MKSRTDRSATSRFLVAEDERRFSRPNFHKLLRGETKTARNDRDRSLNKRLTSISIILLLTATLVISASHSPVEVKAASFPAPVVGVWSNACQSFNITLTNAACGSLSVGTTISVQINVTNIFSGEVEGYEFYMYYDPTYLSATGYDASTPPTIFPSPAVLVHDFVPAGTVHLVGACLHCSATGPGTMVNINFLILKVGVSPLTLAAGLVPNGNAQSFTLLGSPTPQGDVHLVPTTVDGYFKNEPTKLGPKAIFTFAPASAKLHQLINFTATGSFDPDNATAANQGITQYQWDFGNGYATTTPASTFQYQPSLPGDFSVRLTVTDDGDHFEGMLAKVYHVISIPLHDMEVQSLTPNPTSLDPGGKITVAVTVKDNGTYPENFNLSVAYGTPPVIFGSTGNQSAASQATLPFQFKLDTTGFTPGIYNLTATVTTLPSINNTRALDQIPLNDIAITEFEIKSQTANTSSLPLIAGSVVAVVAVLAVIALLQRKRARARAEE